jgi:hypothetical protein
MASMYGGGRGERPCVKWRTGGGFAEAGPAGSEGARGTCRTPCRTEDCKYVQREQRTGLRRGRTRGARMPRGGPSDGRRSVPCSPEPPRLRQRRHVPSGDAVRRDSLRPRLGRRAGPRRVALVKRSRRRRRPKIPGQRARAASESATFPVRPGAPPGSVTAPRALDVSCRPRVPRPAPRAGHDLRAVAVLKRRRARRAIP